MLTPAEVAELEAREVAELAALFEMANHDPVK